MNFQIEEIYDLSKYAGLQAKVEELIGLHNYPNRHWWIAIPEFSPGEYEFAGFSSLQVDYIHKTIYLGPSYVIPYFRNNGLQTQFIKVREEWGYIRECDLAMSCTDYTNLSSANNLIKNPSLHVI